MLFVHHSYNPPRLSQTHPCHSVLILIKLRPLCIREYERWWVGGGGSLFCWPHRRTGPPPTPFTGTKRASISHREHLVFLRWCPPHTAAVECGIPPPQYSCSCNFDASLKILTKQPKLYCLVAEEIWTWTDRKCIGEKIGVRHFQ